ncbi:MAG: thiamine diphosphokinase [Candidatus Levybacteria bacterium]|nr:thiamine diphosphokinase [Candidatus Levybacteria bacterium]
MKKAIIFLNGDRTDVSRIKNVIDDQTLVIGCDGGVKHAINLGITPHVILGDMDSISAQLKKTLEKKHVKFISFPTKKDNTDAELALLYAVKHGCSDIVITGMLGTRIDHMLATILMLSQKQFSKTNIRIIEGNQNMYIVHKKIELTGKKGDTVSIIPIINSHGLTTKNLAYKLSNATLSFGTTRGISNMLIENKAEIFLKKGMLLVVHKQ